MAERPVYVTTLKVPYVSVYKPEFTWNTGLNAVQKQKNIVALHDAFKRLYINALAENSQLTEEIMEFDAFTDIEFNPNKSLNCQARAAALFVAMKKLDRLNQCQTFQGFLTAIR